MECGTCLGAAGCVMAAQGSLWSSLYISFYSSAHYTRKTMVCKGFSALIIKRLMGGILVDGGGGISDNCRQHQERHAVGDSKSLASIDYFLQRGFVK